MKIPRTPRKSNFSFEKFKFVKERGKENIMFHLVKEYSFMLFLFIVHLIQKYQDWPRFPRKTMSSPGPGISQEFAWWNTFQFYPKYLSSLHPPQIRTVDYLDRVPKKLKCLFSLVLQIFRNVFYTPWHMIHLHIVGSPRLSTLLLSYKKKYFKTLQHWTKTGGGCS